MTNFFSVNNANDGMRVGPEYYMQQGNSRHDVGMGIVNNLTQDLGLAVGDIVDMMVTTHMGMRVEGKQAEITNKNIEMGALNIVSQELNNFQSHTIQPLNNPNALTSYGINNSSPDAVSARIGATGLNGNVDFNLRVNELAQSQSLLYSGFESSSSPVGEGTLTINFGEYADGQFLPNESAGQFSITVTDGMTLQDVATEINAQSGGPKAEVVQDPDGTYSLALVGPETGKDMAMQVTGTGDLTDFGYNGQDTAFVSEMQPAQDAEYEINGIPMTSPSNNISYQGVEMTLARADGEDIKISSEAYQDGVVDNVHAFVSNYNDLAAMFNMFNEASPYYDYVGSLYGTDISKAIADEMEAMWSGIQAAGLSMHDLGITKMADGSLRLDEATLRKNLETNPNIAKDILASTSSVSADWMTIVTNGQAIDGNHEIMIDEAPEKARYVGAPLADPTVVNGEFEMEFRVNGKLVEFSLDEGEYTPAQIASRMSAAIAGAGVQGFSVSADQDGALVFESSEYGTSQFIDFPDDVPLLGITEGRESGVDVKGYINGQRVIGNGTTLTSRFDPATEGLVISIDPDNLVLGETHSLDTKTGVLDRMSAAFENLTNPLTGTIHREILDIESMLSENGQNSLVKELEALERERDHWYEFYLNLYSGLASTLQNLSAQEDFLNTMLNPSDD